MTVFPENSKKKKTSQDDHLSVPKILGKVEFVKVE